jgi:hypothetical protein
VSWFCVKVEICADTNQISVWNNGNGIPVVMHQEHNVYVPELIFGHLLTGTRGEEEITIRNEWKSLYTFFFSQVPISTTTKKRRLGAVMVTAQSSPTSSQSSLMRIL